MGKEYLRLVKFIKYYSQFKPLKLNPLLEQESLQRLSDSFDTDLDYSKVLSDESNEPPTEI